MRRVARYDGLLPAKIGADGALAAVTPDDIRDMKAFVEDRRAEKTPFDIVMEGETSGEDSAQARETLLPLAEAGVTWWLETMWSQDEPKEIRARLEQGPPRIE